MAPVGSNVYYRFAVTNVGALPVAVTLTDNLLSSAVLAVCDTDVSAAGVQMGIAAPGATLNCVVGPVVAISGNVTNTATASGTGGGVTDTSTDSATYAGQYNGFTPGFWKNFNNRASSTARAPMAGKCRLLASKPWNTTLASIFTVVAGQTPAWLATASPIKGATYGQLTLAQALGLSGGLTTEATQILIRAATATYLNACYNGIKKGARPAELTPDAVATRTTTLLNGFLAIPQTVTRDQVIALAAYFDGLNNGLHQLIP